MREMPQAFILKKAVVLLGALPSLGSPSGADRYGVCPMTAGKLAKANWYHSLPNSLVTSWLLADHSDHCSVAYETSTLVPLYKFAEGVSPAHKLFCSGRSVD